MLALQSHIQISFMYLHIYLTDPYCNQRQAHCHCICIEQEKSLLATYIHAINVFVLTSFSILFIAIWVHKLNGTTQ